MMALGIAGLIYTLFLLARPISGLFNATALGSFQEDLARYCFVSKKVQLGCFGVLNTLSLVFFLLPVSSIAGIIYVLISSNNRGDYEAFTI
jgi:hypothetical protein